MQLYALVRGAPHVRRIQLAQNIQHQVLELFRNQAKAFLSDVEMIPFAAAYKLDDGELFEIESFDDPYKSLLTDDQALSTQVLPVNDATLEQMFGLFVVVDIEGQRTACIQTFDRRQALIKSKFTFIDFGEGLTRLKHSGLTLDNTLSAVLQGSTLRFKSYALAGRFFDLTDYFHEATEGEIVEFASHKALATEDMSSFQKLAISPRARKQIALVLASKILDQVPAQKIVSEAKRQFKIKLPIIKLGNVTKLVMPTARADLKLLLDFLLENFYKGCLTKKMYVSNSKRVPQILASTES